MTSNVIYAAGASAGAPLGGLLADSIGWRWAFMAQGPLCLAAVIAVALVLDLPKQDQSHWKEKFFKIDFLGAATLIIAVSGLLVGLDRGSNGDWTSPITIAGLCTTPMFIVFVLVEKYVARNPFAPGRIILNRSLFACYLCNFFSFGGWLASLYFIPLYWQVIGNYSAARAGLLLVPSILFGVSGSLAGGFYMKKTGTLSHLGLSLKANMWDRSLLLDHRHSIHRPHDRSCTDSDVCWDHHEKFAIDGRRLMLVLLWQWMWRYYNAHRFEYVELPSLL